MSNNNIKAKNRIDISGRIDPFQLQKARGARSIAAVARAIGVTRQHLWQIENGRSAPSAEVLAKLCFIYDIRPPLKADRRA